MTPPHDTVRRPRARAVASHLVAAVLFAAAGCVGPRDSCTATGKVLVDRAPAEGVSVVFTPVGMPGVKAEGGSARSTKDGSFALGIDKPGEQVVTAFWPRVATKGDDVNEEGDLLNGKYRDPDRPVTKVQVHEGENAVPPFELARPPSDKAKGNRR